MATSLIPAGVLPNIAAICAEVIKAHPLVTHVWGYATTPDHNNRRCIDYMTTDTAVGDAVADYQWEHRTRLGLHLSSGTAASAAPTTSPASPPELAKYTGRNPHTDHVHVQYAVRLPSRHHRRPTGC